MTRKGGGNGSIAWVVMGVVALVFVICTVLLGMDRAWPIARDAALGVGVDPFLAKAPGTVGLPVIELRHGADGAGELRMQDEVVPVQVASVADGLHVVPQGTLTAAPFKKLALRTPATTDGLQGHMALWLAGMAGTPVASNTPVLVAVNGAAPRMMELCEVVGTDMEQVRGLAPLPVQVGPTVPVPQWGGAGGFTGNAARRATALDHVLADTQLTAYARRDTIAAVLDLDAYLCLLGAWQLLGRTPAQCTWVYTERTHRFMPVLVQAVLQADTSMTTDEGLAAVVLGDATWRAQSEDHARSAREEVLEGDRFDGLWSGYIRQLASIPSQARGSGGGESRHVEPSRAMRMEEAARVRAAALERLHNGSNTMAP